MNDSELKKWILRAVLVWVFVGALLAVGAFTGILSRSEFMASFLAGMVLFSLVTAGLNQQLVERRKNQADDDQD